jgi:hypothetical protein
MHKNLVDISIFEKGNAENLQDFVHTAIYVQLLSDDGDENIHTDCDPNLSLDSVLGCAKECFYAQVLFDPLEEQFHLPSALVELRNDQCRKVEVVGQKDQPVVGFYIEITDTTEWYWILPGGFWTFEEYRLIASQTGRFVDMTIASSPVVDIAPGPDYEKRKVFGEDIQTSEIDVASVHNVESTRFWNKHVEDIDIVNASFRNAYKRRYTATQVQKRVELDRSFSFAKPSPRKQRKTEIDSCGIENVCDLIQFHSEGVLGIQHSCHTDQNMAKVRVNLPGSFFVCIGQGTSADFAPKADMEEFGVDSTQTCFDIAQTLPVGQLCKCHTKELIAT